MSAGCSLPRGGSPSTAAVKSTDVIVQRKPSVRLRVSRAVIEDEALGVDEPFKLVQEQAAPGIEGGLAVLKGSVNAPVRGRERAR